jgi:dihydrofolate synthase/folylpolyglutamate synthase
MLGTKDRLSAMTSLAQVADHWHFATVNAAKAASAEELHATWRRLPRRAPAACHASVESAYRAAANDAQPGDRIIAIGSFITVGEVLRLLAADELSRGA